jgi:P-type Cu+ transporter
MLSRIIAMVEEAQASKAPIQGLADRISAVFVPIVLGISILSLLAWLALGAQFLTFEQAIAFGLLCFVGVLVIACPCTLGLATPTAIVVGVGKGAREGILVRDAASLEKLSGITTVIVDKTGTITKGRPELIAVHPLADASVARCLSLLAALEQNSEHPIAHAILSGATERSVVPAKATDFSALKGRGVRATIEGEEYVAGSVRLIEELGLLFDARALEEETGKGRTPIILASRATVLAVAYVADALREDAKESIRALHAMGKKVVMVTGDDANAASFIAGQVGIDEVVARALPEDKREKVRALQSRGETVAMVGDGINDAPALAQADVGIAMGSGTDVAIESAGITLLRGDISKLVKAIRLSRLTMRGIRQNLFWAFIYNLIGIPIAAGALYPVAGILISPVVAGLAMALSSVSVVSNSLRLRAVTL